MRPSMSARLPAPSTMRGVVLVDDDPLGLAEVVQRDALELDAELFGDHLAAGEDGDVLEHGLAAVAEARGLHRDALERAADLVDDERRQRLALDVLGDHDERPAGLGDLLEDREQVLHVADLLLVDEEIRDPRARLHALGIGHEVGREVAAVELHALDDLEGGLEALGLLDRDDAFLADLVHRLGDDLADGGVVVGGDGADLGDLLLVLGGLREALQLGDDRADGAVDAALEAHRVVAGGDHLDALGEDGAGEHGRGRRAVAGDVGGLAGDFLHHLGAHVLELVLELDFLGDGDAVLGDVGRAERLLEDHVAALGAEGHGDGVREDVHSAQDAIPRVLAESYVLGCHVLFPP